MGGKSKATFEVDADQQAGVFDGSVEIVPSLGAPGFCTMRVRGGSFPDVSTFDALELVVRSTVPYSSFKAEFGPAPSTSPFHAGSYKANFELPVTEDWQTVTVPFNMFTSKWEDTTGEPSVKCSDDASVCPDAEHLSALTDLEIAAEGVAGSFHLEVKSISVVTMERATVV